MGGSVGLAVGEQATSLDAAEVRGGCLAPRVRRDVGDEVVGPAERAVDADVRRPGGEPDDVVIRVVEAERCEFGAPTAPVDDGDRRTRRLRREVDSGGDHTATLPVRRCVETSRMVAEPGGTRPSATLRRAATRLGSRHPLSCRKLDDGDVSERPKVQLSKSCVG